MTLLAFAIPDSRNLMPSEDSTRAHVTHHSPKRSLSSKSSSGFVARTEPRVRSPGLVGSLTPTSASPEFDIAQTSLCDVVSAPAVQELHLSLLKSESEEARILSISSLSVCIHEDFPNL